MSGIDVRQNQPHGLLLEHLDRFRAVAGVKNLP